MIRAILGAVLVVLLAAPAAAQHYSEPENGALLLGHEGPTLPLEPGLWLCPPYFYGTFPYIFDLWAWLPDEPVIGVRFSVIIPEGSGVSPLSLYSGIVDLSEPGDLVFDLVFDECLHPTPGELVPLHAFMALGWPRGPAWMCITSPDNIQAEWTTCEGETMPVDTYPPEGLSYPPGCFSVSVDFCAVGTEGESWSTVKVRYR